MSNKKKFKKKKIIIPLISIAVVGLAVGGIIAKRYSDSIVKVVPAGEATGIFSQDGVGKIPVSGTLKKGYIQNVNVDGDLKIKNVKVEKGDKVQKGDVLFEYDTESLQLNVDGVQTEIDILTNEIKIAENELVTLKGLIPAENKPVETPIQPPTLPAIEDEEEIVFDYEKQITEKTTPVAGDGSENSPFVFNVGMDTVVKKQYMQYLAGEKVVEAPTATTATEPTEVATEVTTEVTTEATTEPATEAVKKNSKYAIFFVYSEDGVLMYSWTVDGTKLTDSYIADWSCSKGVVIADDGSVQVNQGANPFATLGIYMQEESGLDGVESLEDLYAEYLSGLAQMSDEYENMYNGNGTINENYLYTKAELKIMISDKENEINDLKFRKRQSEINLSTAQKLLENGSEVAEISGTVTFVAGSEKEAIKQGAYVTVVNDAATTIVCAVSENDLPQVSIGTKVTVSKDISGSECVGEVIHIAEDAISNEADYQNYDIYDDTISHFEVTVELAENMDLKENEGVIVVIDTTEYKDSIWVENAFIRFEQDKCYVMVANEDNVIEKRYVEIGESYFGMSTEITAGLTGDDRIALPYGKTKEGMPTVDATYDELNSGLLF